MTSKDVVFLDGESLTPEILVELSQGNHTIDLSPSAWERVKSSREVITNILEKGKPVYGINTGFGNFATVSIPHDKLEELQRNLIISHSAGVGTPLNPKRTRMLLALRINVLAKGYSGISEETLRAVIRAFNLSLLSIVPEQGTVGASGDLAPLSHLTLGLLGIGSMHDPEVPGAIRPAEEILSRYNFSPLKLKAKEGLALINGTQFMASLGAEALVRGSRLAATADIITALTLESLLGTKRAFDERIHAARPHPGQVKSASRLRALLAGESEISHSHAECNRVQDAYTLRCAPQVHGVCWDTIQFVRSILQTELNSATDNPMVFSETQEIISGGNFHGEYVAKALDYLAIGLHEIGSISERRIERLVNGTLSDLPHFLINEGGLNSGFMIAHCTAASLVSENKVLCHPSSVDSLPTSAGKEDHVSMGGFAARKVLNVLENVEKVVAIELVCAAQALEFRRPLHTTVPLEAVYSLLRSKVPFWSKDQFCAPALDSAWQLVSSGEILGVVQKHLPKEFTL